MILSMLLLSLAMQGTPFANREIITDLPKTWLPEGVAWDTTHSRLLVGSVRENRIASVDPANGHSTVFSHAPGSVLGLHVDPATNTVWAAWTRFGHGFDHNSATGVAAWSLKDGHAVGNWELPDRDPHMDLGDLLIVDAHTIVTSDSGTGAIWRFDRDTHQFTKLVAPGKFRSPQGLALGRMPGTIYLADYSTGLWRIKLADGAAVKLSAPAGSEVRGIDGLYRRGDLLIAVQNGTRTPRVLALTLAAGDSIITVKRWREMPGEEPCLGTFADDTFWFVANGQWGAYDDDLQPKPDASLQPPRLRGLPLSEVVDRTQIAQ